MTWNPNTPLVSDKLRNFPGAVTTNCWPLLQTMIQTDHQFNNTPVLNDNSGYHTVIHFVNQAMTPTAVVGTGELYTKTKDGTETLFFQEGRGREIQITGPATTGGSSSYVTLPGGYILQGGVSNVNLNSTTNISFGITYTNVYSVQVTPVRNSSNVDIVYLVSVSTTGFIVRNTSSAGITQIDWMAFGRIA